MLASFRPRSCFIYGSLSFVFPVRMRNSTLLVAAATESYATLTLCRRSSTIVKLIAWGVDDMRFHWTWHGIACSVYIQPDKCICLTPQMEPSLTNQSWHYIRRGSTSSSMISKTPTKSSYSTMATAQVQIAPGNTFGHKVELDVQTSKVKKHDVSTELYYYKDDGHPPAPAIVG